MNSVIDKMRVLRNVWFFALVIVTTEVAWQPSSDAVEKAIKSLGNKFDKLIAAVNAISKGKATSSLVTFAQIILGKINWRALLASSLQEAQSAMN